MATRTYVGGAVSVAEVYTLAIAGTWATSDTITLTVAGKDLVLTIGATATNAQIATEIVSAWNGTPTLGSGYSVNQTGNNIPVMNEVTASVSTTTVTFTMDTAGIPFTMSRSLSSGSGTATLTNTVDATGPSFFDNTSNWLEGSVATTGDDMIWNSPVSIKYAIDQNTVTLTSLTIGPSVTTAYQIGLPSQNANGYPEWRDTELAISVTSLVCNGYPGLLKLNVGTNQLTATINSSGTSLESGKHAIQIRGTHASNAITINGGDVGLAASNETATFATITQTGGVVETGTAVTSTTLAKQAGACTLNSAITTASSSAGSLTIQSGSVTSLTVSGGSCTYNGSGTCTTLTQLGGSVTTGSGTTVTTWTKQKGTIYAYGTVSTLTNHSDSAVLNKGNMTALYINAGSVDYRSSGTITSVQQSDGTLTASSASTVTAITKINGTATLYGTATTVVNHNGAITIGTGDMTSFTVNGGTATYLGSGTITALNQSGGSVFVDSTATAVTTLNKSNGTSTILCAATTATNEGGLLTIGSGNSTTINAVNGTVNYNGSGTITTLNLSNAAVFNVDGGTGSMTITNFNYSDNAKFRNSTGRVTFSNAFAFQGVLSLSPLGA